MTADSPSIIFENKITMKRLILLVAFCTTYFISFGQQISQLGIWSNNANFVIKYYQDKVITSTTSGITFIDVSNPMNPVPSASIGNPANFPMAIEIDGTYAYFGGGMTGYFMVADISNINFPVQAGITFNISGTAYQIAIKGNYAFMPTNADSLYAIDISNKTAPVVVHKINLGSFSSGIAIKGNYAYVGTSGGLKVVDISNPLTMNIVNTFGSGYAKLSTDTLNNRLFVSKSGQGFDVIDISVPTNPSGLFQGIGGNSSGDLIYKNGHVFQIGSGNVSAFQINSTSATYLTSFNSTITGQVNAVSAKDSVFYLSTVNNVHVLKISTLTTEIKNISNIESVSIYPNPVSDIIFFENFLTNEIKECEIYNLSGILMANKTIVNNSLLINDLPKGLYFIHVVANNTNTWKKFIKK